MSPFLFCLLPVPWSLFPVLCSLYPVCHSLFPVFCFLLFDSCSLSPVPCSLFTVLSPLFPIPCSIPRSLFPVPCSLFPVPRSLFLHFIPFPRSTFVFLHARKWRLFHIYSSTFIYVSLFLKQIAHFLFFYVIHISVLIIFKLCIYAESINLNHKNYSFLDYDCFQKLTFSINLLAKLLSDSLFWDNSISQLHPKL